MKKYESYKTIGLPWLEKIPEHWKIFRNKNIFEESKETVGENFSQYTLLSLTLNGIIPRDVESGKGKFPQSFDTYKIVNVGDMAFCLFDIDETPRTVGLSTHKGMLTGAYNIFHVKNINSKYINYYYLSLDTVKAMKPLYTGLRKTIGIDTFMGVKIPVPPYEEQNQIVRYLDWQTSKINKLIKAKKQIMSRLNEKKQATITSTVTHGLEQDIERIDSGIDYIGQIPSHWKVLLNHRIYKEKSRKFVDDETVLSLSQKDGLLPYENMKERSLHTASYDNWKLVFPNDLVLNRFKAHLGVFFSSNYRGIVTFHYGVFEPVMEIVSKYYEALYHTAEFKRIFASKSNGMTVGLQNLSNANFYSVYTLYPPYEEQCQIVCRIEEVEEKYRKLICRINKEIECLHEYRVRLISDVVTGQIDVRRIEVPEFESVEETIENIDTEDGHETIEWGDMK